MSAVYFIGDLHLGHKKVVEFRPWPTLEAHDAELIRRWNAVVRKTDTVYVVGDCALGSAGLAQVSRLRGFKKLVLGNHDTFSTPRYLEHFGRVVGSAEVNGWLVTHIPVHESQFARWPLNIHGHTHSRALPDPRYFCVSAEQIDYTPITVEEIARRRSALLPKSGTTETTGSEA